MWHFDEAGKAKDKDLLDIWGKGNNLNSNPQNNILCGGFLDSITLMYLFYLL